MGELPIRLGRLLIELLQTLAVQVHVEDGFAVFGGFGMPAGSWDRPTGLDAKSLAHQGKGTAEDHGKADRVEKREQHAAEPTEGCNELNVKNC